MKHKEEIPAGYREIKTLGDLKIKKEVQWWLQESSKDF
jgi:hypothetical protein